MLQKKQPPQTNYSTMIRKKIGTRLEKIVSKYFSNQYTTSFSVFDDFKATVEGVDIDSKTMSHLQRLLQIFFSGNYLTSIRSTVFLCGLGFRMGTKELNIKIYATSLQTISYMKFLNTFLRNSSPKYWCL